MNHFLMEWELNCYELQKEIQKQMLHLKVLNEQIDRNQGSVTSMLKQLLVSKYLYINRLHIMENCDKSKIKDILKYFPMQGDKFEIADSFTSLDLPEDFSTVPIKSFLNALFDSFESFLPSFHKINPSKIPRNKSMIDSTATLLRTVFPALFGYCWAAEPAKAYADQLVYWFSQILKENQGIYRESFDKWFSHAMRGFYASLNTLPFIRETFQEVFFEFIQIYNSADKFNAKILLGLAQKLLQKIKQNYYLLPDVLNSFYRQIFDAVDQSENITDKESTKMNLIQILFFENLIRPVFLNPLLYGVCEVPIVNEDSQYFSNIYLVFGSKFNSKERLPDIDKELAKLPEFDDFKPLDIYELMINEKAKLNLPSLATFCDIVQCAHQPLFFTTKSILLLFRFIVSIQQFSDFPRSIERPIKNITEQGLTEALEDLDESAFWFQCFSMKYLGVENVEIRKKKNNSPLYMLLSSPSVILSPTQSDARKALQESLSLINTTTDAKIRSQMLYILKNADVSAEISNLSKEISTVDRLLAEISERAKRLNILGRTLSELTILSNHSGVKISIAAGLAADFISYANEHQSGPMMEKITALADSYLGSSTEFLEKYLLMMFALTIKPSTKNVVKKHEYQVNDDVVSELRKMVSRPLNITAVLPRVMMLAKDVSTILVYGMMNGIEIPVLRCYSPPFIENPASLAKSISDFMNELSPTVKNKIFDDKELQAIDVFLMTFL